MTQTRKYVRSDPLELWLHAVEKQAMDQWFDSPRRGDYIDVCLELRRMAAESGRSQLAESGFITCFYGPDPRRREDKGKG